MDVTIRRSSERGRGKTNWLESFFTFSFADYYDPAYVGFRKLLVLNEDWIAPGQGFGKHRHKDMEILTYMISGELRHEDSLGHSLILKEGDVQVMSAGKGIFHSEVNASSTKPLHLLQIWIEPKELSLPPRHQEAHFELKDQPNTLVPIIGENLPLFLHQDVSVYASALEAEKELSIEIPKHRHAWIQLIEGSLTVEEHLLRSGDGAALTPVSDHSFIKIKALSHAHFLYFDLS